MYWNDMKESSKISSSSAAAAAAAAAFTMNCMKYIIKRGANYKATGQNNKINAELTYIYM